MTLDQRDGYVRVRYLRADGDEVEVVMRDDAVVITHEPFVQESSTTRRRRVLPDDYQTQTVVGLK